MRRVIFHLAIASAAMLLFTLAATAQQSGATTQSASSVFKSNCAVCHGDDGSGSAVGKSLHAPDLRSAKVQSQSNAELARFISDGKGAMPAFKDRFDHQQILNEIHYVRTLAKHHPAHQD